VWTCLVEVKTSGAELRPEQVSAYLDIAREHAFDGVLTISNQITAASSESPVSVDGRKLKRAALWHFSWWRVLTEAIVQHRYRGVSDPDQAWILGERIAYLDSAASGAGGFEDMGDKWVAVRKAAHDGTLRANDPEARTVAERWEEFTQYLCLGLSQDLGRSVVSPRPRGQTTPARLDESVKQLAADGTLTAVLRVPDAIGDIRIRADLRARRTLTSVTIDAPREGRAKPRINWLLRQLADAPEDLRNRGGVPECPSDNQHAARRCARRARPAALRCRPQARAAVVHDHTGPNHGSKARQGRRVIRPRDPCSDVRLPSRDRAAAKGLAGASPQAPRTGWQGGGT
jgi:hypothetical protein